MMLAIQLYLSKIFKFIKGKLAAPADIASGNQRKFYLGRLVAEWRLIKIIDIIIYLFVFASIKQLAWVFGRGTPELSDWAKGIAFALAEASFARAASRAWIVKQSALPIWIALFVVMALTIPLYITYEWARIAPNKPYDMSIVSTDWLVLMLATLSSGLIGAMILGLSYIRMVQEKIFQSMQKEFSNWKDKEEKRRLRNEYDRKRRDEQKKLKRKRKR